MSVRSVEPAPFFFLVPLGQWLSVRHCSKDPAGDQNKYLKRRTQMKDKLFKLSIMLQILKDENGQDLIEYALVVALIAFAATAGMGTLANDITNALAIIGSPLTSTDN